MIVVVVIAVSLAVVAVAAIGAYYLMNRGGGNEVVADKELISALNWLRENTPENSTVAIDWSLGHLCNTIARRRTVWDGAENLGEEGKWENITGVRPPNYIYCTIDSARYIYGIDIPARPFAINGRRIDVQRLPLMDDREFRWLVQTYRENYKCQIDYVIFYKSLITFENVYYGAWYPAWSMWSNGFWKAQAVSFSKDGQNLVFNFGENRENVVLDPQRNVFLQTDNARKSLAGCVSIYVDNNLTLTNVDFNYPTPTPDIPETLLVFYGYENEQVLIRQNYDMAPSLLDLSMPMDVRVFSQILYNTDYLAGIDYLLENVYTSPGGQITVCRVNY